ncbi:Fic family protein [Agromyces sp. NPDC058110]|uniref:Fic family protein n=1 Tax=Agromyces sp. NPDC058110 TaxID=3346345 RepID=UPI0036DD5E1C
MDDRAGDADRSQSEIVVPPHERLEVPWRQTHRGGTAQDRMLDRIEVSIPPDLGDLDLRIPNPLLAECDDALQAIARLDELSGDQLSPLATLLLRAESVASSKIEHEDASIQDFARAMHGVRANSSATSMVAASGAMDRLLDGPITAERIGDAHRLLMAHDPTERSYAGRWRDMQNWIGGSNHSPRMALYVPPPPGRVPQLMDDLMSFTGRRDLPAIVQAAIAHAQFESIHPFTDGNGRIGRALAAAVIRQRGVARRVVVPIASALVARRESYFATLDRYRAGDAGPIVRAFARSAAVASEEALVTGSRLATMPERWAEATGRPRAASAPSRVLASLPTTPVFTADDLERRLGLSTPATYRAIERLAGAGVIAPLTDRTRDQIWGVTDVLDELEDLGARIGSRASQVIGD